LLARSMILGAFLGVDRFYQYAWDNGRSGMLYTRSLRPTPSAAAFDSVRRWLVGTTLQGCRLDVADTVHCTGTRKGDRLQIWWRPESTKASRVHLPRDAQITAAEYAVDRTRTIDLQDIRASGITVGADPVAVWWHSPNGSDGAKR